MRKGIIFILLASTILSCDKDALPENEQSQDFSVEAQQRAPSIPDPVIIGQENT